MTGGWFTGWEPRPDVFAVVMATGIVSVAGNDHGYWRLGIALGILALVAFAGLAVGFLLWATTRRARFMVLARDLDAVLRMFTFVAASAVLDVRWGDHPAAGWLLGGLALAAWLVLVPLAAVDVASWRGADLRKHARGAWLLPSVATAGLATTASTLAIDVRLPALVVVAALAWVLAMVFYLLLTGLIAWRALAAPLVPDEVTPDSWILMGALAITALAGDHILAAVHTLNAPSGLVTWTRPVTLAAWVLASLWVPVLLYAQVWRVDHVPGSLRYQGVWWSAVFPLGMYSAASGATVMQLHMRSLRTVSLVSFWIAFTVWALVAMGLAHSAVGRRAAVRAGSAGPSPGT